MLAEHRRGHILQRQKGPQCAAGAVGLDRGEWLDLGDGVLSRAQGQEQSLGDSPVVVPPACSRPAIPRGGVWLWE